jgi:HK97 family phage major capsid protein
MGGELDALDAKLSKAIEDAEREQRSADLAERYQRFTGSEDNAGPWLPGLQSFQQLRLEGRAVGTTGAFIPVQYANTYFDLLRKRTAVLAAGPVRMNIEEAGSLKVPRVTSAITVGSVAEGVAITPADPTLSDITLDPKKIAAMTLVNSEAVDDSRPELRGVVGNSLVRDLAVELDRQLVTGDGTSNTLTGLRNITGFTTGAATGANGGALSFDFLADTMGAADTANLDSERLAWFMHSRSWASIRKLKDSQLRPIFALNPASDLQRSIFGAPVFLSNSLSITETVGTSTDCSTIMLVDMSQVVVGVARDVLLEYSSDFGGVPGAV